MRISHYPPQLSACPGLALPENTGSALSVSRAWVILIIQVKAVEISTRNNPILVLKLIFRLFSKT